MSRIAAIAANDEVARSTAIVTASAADDRARRLLERIAAGDQPAFEELYRMLSRRVHAFARRITGHAKTADEITVDTMHEVWRSAGRFRSDSQVSTWVLGIARNKSLMALRKMPRAECVDIADFGDTLESGVPDGFAQLARKELCDELRQCMRQLSVPHRECLHLAYFEDMSITEIAALLDIPEGTVKSRMSHARVQLAAGCSSRLRQSLH